MTDLTTRFDSLKAQATKPGYRDILGFKTKGIVEHGEGVATGYCSGVAAWRDEDLEVRFSPTNPVETIGYIT